MSDKYALIIGASRGLGRALAELLSENYHLILSSRESSDLNSLHSHISRSSKKNHQLISIDLNDSSTENITSYIDKCYKLFPRIDLCIVTAGAISNRDTIDNNELNDWEGLISSNFVSISKIVFIMSKKMLLQDIGKVWICSSISIHAPRSVNILYGSSKSALDYFCRALQSSFFGTNVHVGIIRLGYLQTEMTKGKKLLFPIENPYKAADRLLSIFNTRKKIVYLPGYWRFITTLIRITPLYIYHRIIKGS